MEKSIRCSSCGTEIKPRWGQNEVKCPICGGVLSVMQEQKGMEMTDSNRINVIRYEAGNDMLVSEIAMWYNNNVMIRCESLRGI